MDIVLPDCSPSSIIYASNNDIFVESPIQWHKYFPKISHNFSQFTLAHCVFSIYVYIYISWLLNESVQLLSALLFKFVLTLVHVLGWSLFCSLFVPWVFQLSGNSGAREFELLVRFTCKAWFSFCLQNYTKQNNKCYTNIHFYTHRIHRCETGGCVPNIIVITVCESVI